MIRRVMRALCGQPGEPVTPILIKHGAARGADRLAGVIARGMGLPVQEFPAHWDTAIPRHLAGHQRNQRMLDDGADLVVGFKDGFNFRLDRGGTEDMIRRAVLAGVPTCLYSHDATPSAAPAQDEAPQLQALADALKAQAGPEATARVLGRDEGPRPTAVWEPLRDPRARPSGD
jgi:hypothetical protein